MFTAAIILMEIQRRRRRQREAQGNTRHRWHQDERFSRIPSEFFCESLYTMHDSDHAGLVLATETPSYRKLKTTTNTTTAVVNPVPLKEAKQVKDKDDNKPKKVDDFTDIPRDQLALFGEDGDRLADLQDEITMKKDKRRIVLEQILKLEEKKRRFILNTRLNQRKLRASQRKREELEHDTQAKIYLRYNQLIDVEKEKDGMAEKLERFQDMAIALAMQKEEKHQTLLQLIDNAPALYRKESEILEERHQREVVRYQVVMGVFLALFVLLLITYISRFGVIKEKPATRTGLFY